MLLAAPPKGKKSPRFQTQNLPRLALDDDFKRPAAYLAVGRKALLGEARVDDDFKGLATKGTLNGRGNFHAADFLSAPSTGLVENARFAHPWRV